MKLDILSHPQSPGREGTGSQEITPSLFASDHPELLARPRSPRYAIRSCILDVPTTYCIVMNLFQRARRVLATRSLLDDQNSHSPEARPRSYGAITTSPQLHPIREAPAGRQRTRRSRSAPYYDLPRTFLRPRGLILSLFLHRQPFLCCVLPAIALPRPAGYSAKGVVDYSTRNEGILRIWRSSLPRTLYQSPLPAPLRCIVCEYSVDGVS